MVSSINFKQNIRELISQEYELIFLGGSEKVNQIIEKIRPSQAEDIYLWIKKIINLEIRPITISSKKNYKDWKIKDLLSFRKEININNNEYRILFIKLKNSYYIEFHLGDHKYYDKLRKKLDLTKKNY